MLVTCWIKGLIKYIKSREVFEYIHTHSENETKFRTYPVYIQAMKALMEEQLLLLYTVNDV